MFNEKILIGCVIVRGIDFKLIQSCRTNWAEHNVFKKKLYIEGKVEN